MGNSPNYLTSASKILITEIQPKKTSAVDGGMFWLSCLQITRTVVASAMLSIERRRGYTRRISRWSPGPNSSAGLGHWHTGWRQLRASCRPGHSCLGIPCPPGHSCPGILATSGHSCSATLVTDHSCLISLLNLNFKAKKEELCIAYLISPS